MGSKRIMPQIDHVIVLMMENRSFDSLAGWIYDRDSAPPRIVGRQDPPHYNGLDFGRHSNPDPRDLETQIPVRRGTDNFYVPSPDPHEDFLDMNRQIFETERPEELQEATMKGFLANYATVKGAIGTDIMQTYDPDQLHVFSSLARDYAISDTWHASNPTQTAPNRAFMHAGTSEGRVNNLPLPLYGAKTIYQVLAKQNHSWKVYRPNDQLFSLTRLQMLQLWDSDHDDNFGMIESGDGVASFAEDAANGRLADYTFLEPTFIQDIRSGLPSSEHPPTNVCAGEAFLSRIWDIVRTSKNWHKTLFVITFDEHGGTYDHVPPTWNAARPDRKVYRSLRHHVTFKFNRFGVRIPTVLISPWIAPRTLLRVEGDVPFDHTSILKTLACWKGLDVGEMAHGRIDHAPTIESVLNLDEPRREEPRGYRPRCRQFPRTPAKGEALTILERWIMCCYHLYHVAGHRADKAHALHDEIHRLGAEDRLHPALEDLLDGLRDSSAVGRFLSKLRGDR